MGKLYTAQPITIVLNVTLDDGDLSSATSAAIDYKAPDGTTGQWVGVLDTVAGTVTYEASDSDIVQSGTWALQPIVTFSGGAVLPGTTVKMPITARFE